MTPSEMVVKRLAGQQLEQSMLTAPGEVVAYMGAMQAQDYAGAKWSIGLRLPGSTDADIKQAIADRMFVRTWAMRGTLHFIAAADIRWLLALLAPLIIARNIRRYRELRLSEHILIRSNAVLVEALQGGRQLDRSELRLILQENGVDTGGQRFAFMLQRASLDGLICQIGLRRNNPLFVSLEEWLPESQSLERDEAIAEIARRYFTSRGPATFGDFTGWSGLPVRDAQAGLAAVRKDLVEGTVDGRTCWWSRSLPVIGHHASKCYLLPGFDEFVLGYRDRSDVLDVLKKRLIFRNGMLSPTIVIGDRIAGTWKRLLKKGSVVITSSPFTPFTTAERNAFAAAVHWYGEFLGLDGVWENPPPD